MFRCLQKKNGCEHSSEKLKNDSSFDPVIYSLESPKFHKFVLNGSNLFKGWVFYFGDKKVNQIYVYADAKPLGSCEVNLARYDVATHVPSLPAVENCGFEISVECKESYKKIIFYIKYHDNTKELFFEYDVQFIKRMSYEMSICSNNLDKLKMPDGPTVKLTQGHDNVEEYFNSILPSVLAIKDYLSFSGVGIEKANNLLDFGCGSGRILKGWYACHPEINLYGCDYNSHLVKWIKNNLPERISVFENDLTPPLDCPSSNFDLIYLISVFTHLTLDNQKRWIKEFERILRPDGILLVSLHGEFYVRNAFFHHPEKLQLFRDQGFTTTNNEGLEGSNSFGTFHSLSFAVQLFEKFELLGFFPQGNLPDRRRVFHVALSQDIYVFKLKKNSSIQHNMVAEQA